MRISLFLSFVVLATACSDSSETSGPAATESETGDSTSTTNGTGTDSAGTPTSSPDPSSTTATTTDSTTSEGSSSSSGGAAGSTGAVDHQIPPDSCDVDEDCAEGVCYFVSLFGGVCGECVSDADCSDGGCTPANPLVSPPRGAVCNMGELGGGCESDAVCQDGLECGQLVEVPGIFSLSSCSECASDDACSDGLCSPSVDIAAMTGHRECVPPASLLFGSVCDHLTSGDQACASGHCAPADLAGLIEVGVCGDCSVDTDCDEGMQCVAPQLTLSGAIGSYCA